MLGFQGKVQKAFLKTVGVVSILSLLLLTGCGKSSSSAALSSTSAAELSSFAADDSSQINSSVTDVPQDSASVKATKERSFTLYFPDQGNEAVKKVKQTLSVEDGAVIRACLTGLISGPQSSGLRRAIPEGTRLLGVNFKNGVAIADFSKEFAQANDVAEIVEKVSVVNSVTSIPGVEKMKILIEGKDWIAPSGSPYGEMSAVALDQNGKPIQ